MKKIKTGSGTKSSEDCSGNDYFREKNGKRPVNVYTEWAPLEEAIIGNCINFNINGFDKIFQHLYRDNIKVWGLDKTNYRIAKKYIIERQEDLDKFADILEGRGITVRRPKKLNRVMVIKTPYFKALINAVDDPRDMFLCLDDEIIETPPIDRNRYFEGLMLRHIFMDYFREGSRWTLAPRARLTEESSDFVHWSKVKKIHKIGEIEPYLDIGFDAASCLKFGKDILMNVGNKNHELGAIWLQRHLGNKFNIHAVRITDLHIDGMLMPLRPGVMLVNRLLKKKIHLLPKPLQKWKMIEVSEDHVEGQFNYPADHPQLASFVGMGVNVLSLDENTVCIRDEDVMLREILEENGFTVVPIKLRHCELFGGGIHCATLDVRRDEKLEDYWT